MTINYVNSETLMVTKYPSVLFSNMLAVEDNEMSHIRNPITQLRDVYIKWVLHNKN